MVELKELVAVGIDDLLEGETQIEKFESLKRLIENKYHIEKVLNEVATESYEFPQMLYRTRFMGYKK